MYRIMIMVFILYTKHIFYELCKCGMIWCDFNKTRSIFVSWNVSGCDTDNYPISKNTLTECNVYLNVNIFNFVSYFCVPYLRTVAQHGKHHYVIYIKMHSDTVMMASLRCWLLFKYCNSINNTINGKCVIHLRNKIFVSYFM